jgi:hypothetical protein
MTKPVAPAPEFRQLSESEVHAALNDTDERNPVACEVARLIKGYMENFSAHVERIGRIPESILHVTPKTAIEAVAMRLTTETIQAGMANAVRQKMN